MDNYGPLDRNRRCPKCGSRADRHPHEHPMIYSRLGDVILRRCETCRYRWAEMPENQYVREIKPKRLNLPIPWFKGE